MSVWYYIDKLDFYSASALKQYNPQVDESLCMQTSHCVCRRVTVYVDESLCMQTSHCVCRLVTVYVDESLCMQTSHCVCRRVTVYVDQSQCMQTSHCVCRRVTVYVEEKQQIPILQSHLDNKGLNTGSTTNTKHYIKDVLFTL